MNASSRRSGAAQLSAGAVLATTLLLTATAIVLDVVLLTSGLRASVSAGWTAAIPGLVLAMTGALLLRRAQEHSVAFILLGFGFAGALVGASAAWVNRVAALGIESPLTEPAYYLNQRFGFVTVFALPVVFLFFPDGRLPARGPCRWLGFTALGIFAFAVAAYAAAPWHRLRSLFGQPDSRIRTWDSAYWGVQLPPGFWTAILYTLPVLATLGVLLSILVLASRRIGADLTRRRQLRWIVWGAALFLAVLLGNYSVVPYHAAQLLNIAATVAVCVAILFAVNRYRLASIDQVFSWTVVYALLLGSIVTVDVLLLAAVGHLIGEQTLAIASVVLVFLAYAPLRERVLGLANRLVNGRRGDPYGVMSSLARRLEDSDEADDQLRHIARSVASAFASPYVAVTIDQPGGERLTAVQGSRPEDPLVMPLSYRGERIGALEMAPGRRRTMSHRDERLLADLVRQAVAAVRATTASRELQSIRERLVRAREDERHRLRRELHDGLGPALAGVTMRVDAAKNLTHTRPDDANAVLETVAEDVAGAVAEIRRVVHDLRPPALDDLGLVRALELQCERFSSTGGPRVTFNADIPPLLPAFDVAVYRIVGEALTNVHRHSGASRVRVSLAVRDGALVVEVDDDGIGIPADAVSGVGLRSMRERVEELGGTLAVLDRPEGGTTVRAELPLAERQEEATRV
ncbi:histidine kinase [Lysobacter korlensis]|uniref:Oxygen sensor histidine kinase NreB n=1 Tax=Lysobacter korlensis TaxID=553636 RepID=A0ABV6RU88_9GAMM